MVEALIWVAHL